MSSPLPLVLITGANQGLGWYASRHIAANGSFHVLMGCRNVSKGEAARQSIISTHPESASRLTVVEVDVTSDSSIDACVSATVSLGDGSLAVLVNNAGVDKPPQADVGMRESYRYVMDVNVASAAVMTEKFLPLLRKSNYPGKRIVYVSSSLGSHALSNDETHRYYAVFQHVYRASKSAMNMQATYYNNMLKKEGIAVTTVCPGWCKTQFNNYNGDTEPEDGAMVIAKAATEGKNADVEGKWFEAGGIVPW